MFGVLCAAACGRSALDPGTLPAGPTAANATAPGNVANAGSHAGVTDYSPLSPVGTAGDGSSTDDGAAGDGPGTEDDPAGDPTPADHGTAGTASNRPGADEDPGANAPPVADGTAGTMAPANEDSCADDATCMSSACFPGLEWCGTSCVDPASDEENCGACGVTCTGGMTCKAGACVCAQGRTDCAGRCIDTRKNRNNCGGCGVVCDRRERCVLGACTNVGRR